MKAGIHLDIEEETYHADDAFSQSQAKVLLESPARYRWQRDHPKPPSNAFDEGHAAHAKVLGVGLEVAVIPDEILAANGAISTTAAKEFVKEARERGAVPIKADVAARVDAMAEAILAHPQARRLLELPGPVEASMWWQDEGSGVHCRARVDKLAETPDGPLNVDIKSTADASLRGFTKSCVNFGYHIQGAAYDDAVRHLTGGEAPTVLIAVEKDAPHLVAVFEFTPADLDLGLQRWRDACHLLAKCREDDHWPGFPDFVQTITLPPWA